MFEQDYIMRIIHEIIRSILKLLFNIDLEREERLESEDLQHLVNMVDQGEINEAENMLYEKMDDSNQEELKTALLFYDYLNQLDPQRLAEAGFTYEEIQEGVRNVMQRYGHESLLDIFI